MTKLAIHPTKQQLIDVMVELLDARPGIDVRVDELLDRSGISRGSLYHHFEDYAELVEEAKVHQFARYVDATTASMAKLLGSVSSREELKQMLRDVTKASQSDAAASSRALRARIITEAESIPRFRETLQIEIDRLTGTLEHLVQEVIDRNWFSDKFTARTIAVFIQAYSLGKIINDFANTKITEDEWNRLIDSVVETVFIGA